MAFLRTMALLLLLLLLSAVRVADAERDLGREVGLGRRGVRGSSRPGATNSRNSILAQRTTQSNVNAEGNAVRYCRTWAWPR